VIGKLAWAWGVGGFSVLVGVGLVRLGTQFLRAVEFAWSPLHVVVALVFVGFMAWTEGYRGFQLSYAPKFARRAEALRAHATALQALFGPVYCMGLAWAPARTLVANWALLAMIILLVIAFGFVPQPWRGILDGGVIVGLSWGLAATWYSVWREVRALPSMA